MNRVAAVTAAVALTAGALLAATPAEAAGEHCSAQSRAGSANGYEPQATPRDYVTVYWTYRYRHCGNGASPESYYVRSDRVETEIVDRGPLWSSLTVHYSVSTNGAYSLIGSNIHYTTSGSKSLGGVRSNDPATLRVWLHTDWAPGGSWDTGTFVQGM